MRRMSGYPGWFFSALALIFVALFLSGFFLLPTMLEMRLQQYSPIHIDPEYRLMIAASHSAAAFSTVFLLGALSSIHIRQGMRRKLNMRSGLFLVGSFLILILTTLGIFYFGNENFSLAASAIHSVTGLAIIIPLTWHVVNGFSIRWGLQKTKSGGR